ncbi:conserved hypothetical protein [Ahrensia sp. R2A130]|nr:conserved hypothetical protein [Ahrensia sp. R2A130]
MGSANACTSFDAAAIERGDDTRHLAKSCYVVPTIAPTLDQRFSAYLMSTIKIRA